VTILFLKLAEVPFGFMQWLSTPHTSNHIKLKELRLLRLLVVCLVCFYREKNVCSVYCSQLRDKQLLRLPFVETSLFVEMA